MTQILPNLTADKVTRNHWYAYFRGWWLKQGSRSLADYERGKAWIADLGLTPGDYYTAIQYLAEYLRV